MTTSRRKFVRNLIGLALVGLIASAWIPLYTTPDKMRKFCGELPQGASFNQVKQSARDLGFKVSEIRDGKAMLSNTQAMGRFNCTLTFIGNALSATHCPA